MKLEDILKSPLVQRTKSKILTRAGLKRNAGAYLKVYPDDVFIVSYPRSGNTWMRFLIGGMVFQKDINFRNMEHYVPDIYRCTHSHLRSLGRPRYLKSHEPYDARYPKVIYLVRDPRDVAISYYEWLLKFRKTTKTFDTFMVDFVNNETPYGGWGNHVDSWYQNAERVANGLLFIRYEDLLADTVGKLLDVASFLALDVSVDRVKNVVGANEFARMQRKEDAATDIDLFRDTRADIRFTRRGIAGQWREHLSQDQIVMFANSLGELAHKLGYGLNMPDDCEL